MKSFAWDRVLAGLLVLWGFACFFIAATLLPYPWMRWTAGGALSWIFATILIKISED